MVAGVGGAGVGVAGPAATAAVWQRRAAGGSGHGAGPRAGRDGRGRPSLEAPPQGVAGRWIKRPAAAVNRAARQAEREGGWGGGGCGRLAAGTRVWMQATLHHGRRKALPGQRSAAAVATASGAVRRRAPRHTFTSHNADSAAPARAAMLSPGRHWAHQRHVDGQRRLALVERRVPNGRFPRGRLFPGRAAPPRLCDIDVATALCSRACRRRPGRPPRSRARPQRRVRRRPRRPPPQPGVRAWVLGAGRGRAGDAGRAEQREPFFFFSRGRGMGRRPRADPLSPPSIPR